MKYKQKNKKGSVLTKPILFVILFLVLVFAFNGFKLGSIALDPGNRLSSSSPNLYQYAGTPLQYKDSKSGTCQASSDILNGNYIFSNDASIQTANHNYKISISNLRSGSYVDNYKTSSCSTYFYTANVYQDNILIDNLVFDKCENQGGVSSSDVEKKYVELDVIFGKGFEQGGDLNYCGNSNIYLVNELIPKYPSDTIKFNGYNILSTSSNSAQIELSLTSKADGYVDSNVLLKNSLGSESSVADYSMVIKKGENKIDYTIPITSETGDVSLLPSLTFYASNNGLSGLNGAKIWLAPLKTSNGDIVFGQNSYSYFKIGDFKGSPQTLNFQAKTVTSLPPASQQPVTSQSQVTGSFFDGIVNFFSDIFNKITGWFTK